MGDLKSRFALGRRFLRKNSAQSTASTATCATATTAVDSRTASPALPPSRPRKSSSLARLRDRFAQQPPPEPVAEAEDGEEQHANRRSGSVTLADRRIEKLKLDDDPLAAAVSTDDLKLDGNELERQPTLILQEPTPDLLRAEKKAGFLDVKETSPAESTPRLSVESVDEQQEAKEQAREKLDTAEPLPSPALERPSRSVSPRTRPPSLGLRRQSLLNGTNALVIRNLLTAAPRPQSPSYVPRSRPTSPTLAVPTSGGDYFTPGFPANYASIMHRKIWVHRPGASATLVQIREDDLVDDVRDMILKKYANSLGRTFDAPDMTLRIVSREEPGRPQNERTLGPEEEMCRTIDAYFPGGQTVAEALIIDVPHKRTPRPSPRVYHHNSYQAVDEYRPMENGNDYFPPMPVVVPSTIPQTTQTTASHESRASHHPSLMGPPEHMRSISVLNTGQLPPLPSPGGTRRHPSHRPKYGRQHTSSPTIITHPQSSSATVNPPMPSITAGQHMSHRPSIRPRNGSNASDHGINGIPSAPPLPTPPAPEAPPTNQKNNTSTPPTPSTSAPHHHRPVRPRRSRKSTPTDGKQVNGKNGAITSANPNLPSSMLDGSVPPINVLIVEDNIINLKLLEAFMKRLKVRWSTAMNGRIAVDKWRAGGFHLVLMDIQLPIMSGLEATKEIRRLERVNGIGVFSSSASTSPIERSGVKRTNGGLKEAEEENEIEVTEDDAAHKGKGKSQSDDKLQTDEGLFKSPVIIVALTASSLQSDRHEALAAGCNDFLTKPVNFVWLERKVKEWGCMQALIDFDGWRKWKDFASSEPAKEDKEAKAAKAKKKKRMSTDLANAGRIEEAVTSNGGPSNGTGDN